MTQADHRRAQAAATAGIHRRLPARHGQRVPRRRGRRAHPDRHRPGRHAPADPRPRPRPGHADQADRAHARPPRPPGLAGRPRRGAARPPGDRLRARGAAAAGDTQPRDGEPGGQLRGGFPGTTTRPARLVRDGDVIGSLRVIATPGHTPGHLAFLDTRDGTLYAGDAYTTTWGVATSAVVPWRYPMAGLATWNRDLDLASARALRDLDPDRLASGHGPVIRAPGPAMTRAIEAAARKIDRSPQPTRREDR